MELKHLDIYHIKYNFSPDGTMLLDAIKSHESRFETIQEAQKREEQANRESYCKVDDCQYPYHP